MRNSAPTPLLRTSAFKQQLRDFDDFGKPTEIFSRRFGGSVVPYFVNEFWTAKQRVANSLHEVSYRACFNPQLPRFFIERLTEPGGRVYDPFMGRGTTLIEAALLDRVPLGCDVNPLSRLLCEPRFPLRPWLLSTRVSRTSLRHQPDLCDRTFSLSTTRTRSTRFWHYVNTLSVGGAVAEV